MSEFPYDPTAVLATFHVRHTDVYDSTQLVDVYTVLERPDGYVVMHRAQRGVGHWSTRQATPVLSADSAMSYAMMACGWGPLGGWADHDAREASGDIVRGLAP